MPLSKKALILYSHFLEIVALGDDSLTGVVQNMVLQRSSTSSIPTQSPFFTDSELLGLEMQPMGQLLLSNETRAKVLEEARSVLNSVYQVMYGRAGTPDVCAMRELPDFIEAMRHDIEGARKGLATQQRGIVEMIHIILEARETLRQEIEKGLSSTLHVHAGVQLSRVDLLGATIEESLVKLALGMARAEHALYSQTVNGDITKNMAQALEIALKALKAEEKEKKIELRRLDKDLREYEAVLELVDCGHEGYRQVVSDWTRVQQGTNECLKDLRRLGWTGD